MSATCNEVKEFNKYSPLLKVAKQIAKSKSKKDNKQTNFKKATNKKSK